MLADYTYIYMKKKKQKRKVLFFYFSGTLTWPSPSTFETWRPSIQHDMDSLTKVMNITFMYAIKK
jgi:trehalose-6-phosphatase